MSKSSATIRRRKTKYPSVELEKFKTRFQTPPRPLPDITEVKEDDEGYLFDDEILGPNVVKKIMSSEKTLLLSLISLRVVNSLFIQTHFVPDEFWQSTEVAHNMVFSYGYLTWEWREGIRGYLYPSTFAVLFKLLAILGLDNRLLLIKLPRILQGIFAAFGDLYLYKLSWLLSDRGTAQWTLLCQTISWFMLYTSTRTLANSTETVLVTVALYYFPWPGLEIPRKSSSKFLLFAALSVIVRPTAAVIWVLLCSWHLQRNKHRIFKVLKQYIIIGSIVLVISCVIDRVFYGEWTLVQYNFLLFNVLQGGSTYYGSHPWHWYLTQGYPAIVGTHLIPFILGAYRAKNKVLLLVIIWNIFIYSFLSHKEFRFIMPILPITFHYCGIYFQALCKKPKLTKRQIRKAKATANHDKLDGSQESLVSSIDGAESTTTEISSEPSNLSAETSGVGSDLTDNTKDESDENVSEPQETKLQEAVKKQDLSANEIVAEMEKKQRETHKNNLWKARLLVIFLLVTNIPAAMYFSLIHQRGTILVMKHLHDASEKKNIDVLFLMPCHSTPYYSYLHKNISMRFLTCEPNLHQIENYIDESDIFYRDPVQWLQSEYSVTSVPWPSHIVYFSVLQNDVKSFFSQNGYQDCATFFHTHLPEGRVGTHVMVACR